MSDKPKITGPIYETLITVKVLSRDAPWAFTESDGLKELEYFISEDAGIGDFWVEKTRELPLDQVATELVAIGNDGSFFDDDPFGDLTDE